MMDFIIKRLITSGFLQMVAVSPTQHSVIGFAYLTSGECLAEVNGESLLLSAGQFLMLPSNMSYSIRHMDNCVGYEGAFNEDFLKDSSYAVLHSPKPIHQTFWFEDGVFMGKLLDRISTAYEDHDMNLIRSALDLILVQLHPTTAAALPERFLTMVFNWKERIGNVADYAAILNITPNYLNKSVKQYTHKTAIEWIEISRLNYAKQLLGNAGLPMIDIAAAVGLDDQSYFSRFFKKRTGMTPSEYQKSLR